MDTLEKLNCLHAIFKRQSTNCRRKLRTISSSFNYPNLSDKQLKDVKEITALKELIDIRKSVTSYLIGETIAPLGCTSIRKGQKCSSKSCAFVTICDFKIIGNVGRADKVE